MWDEARQAAASPPRISSRSPTVPTTETDLDEPAEDVDDDDDDNGANGKTFAFDSSAYDNADYAADSPYDNVIDSDSRYNTVPDGSGGVVNMPFFIPDDEDADGSLEDDPDSPELLARHLGVGGHGPLVADRLALLASLSPSSSSSSSLPLQSGEDVGMRRVPKILPSLYFGDLRAGDAAATAGTIELCHERGVQAFSLRYVGGEDGEEAGKGAAAAADYEHEDVSVARTLLVTAVLLW